MKAGVALNPHTAVNNLKNIIQDIDLVCLMSVNPGFGGQSFIESTYKKLKEIRVLIEETNSSCLVEIDGGVTNQNASKLITLGADVLVAGSYIFDAQDPKTKIKTLKDL